LRSRPRTPQTVRNIATSTSVVPRVPESMRDTRLGDQSSRRARLRPRSARRPPSPGAGPRRAPGCASSAGGYASPPPCRGGDRTTTPTST